MNRQDVKSWLESEVTLYFMSMLNTIIQAEDENTHAALQRGDLQEAALCNAGLSAYREVRDILPERMLEDASEIHTET